MPTNKKWGTAYLGHYALNGAGGGPDDDELLAEIEDLPYFKGFQKRFDWNQLEGATPGSYNFAPLITWLDKCQAKGKKLSVLLMYKAFGGTAVPAYITKKPTDAGYNAVYTTDGWYGAYKWGSITEIAAFFNNAVRDRFILFLQAMAAAVDSHPALANVMMNETTMGSPTPNLTTAQKTAIGLAMVKIMQDTIPSFVTTPIGWFVNFPNTGSYSILDVLPPKLQEFGGILAGPDTWFHDTSLENGVVKDYFDSWNGGTPINPRAPSVQNPDYRYYSHADQSSDTVRTDIDIEKLFNRVTGTVETFNTPNVTGGTKQPLHANYVNWSAWNSLTPGTSRRPWVELKALLAKYYAPGGRFAGSTTPGIDLTIPLKYETGTTPGTLPKLTASLATDAGPSNTDKITNVGTVTSDALATGATREFRKGTSGTWSTTQPAVTLGLNTYYVRQTKAGSTPSEISDPLTFTYDNTPPVRTMATIDDNAILIAYESDQDLSNTSGFRPVHGDYTLSISGGGTPPSKTGMFVNGGAKNVRIDLATNATAGVNYLLTYTPAAGDARLMDLAGNVAAGFTNIALYNITGLGNPTHVVTVTGIPGVSSSGGYTNLRNWTVTGTLSAPLAEYEQVQVDRKIGAGSWDSIGYATVDGTNWSMVDNGNFADGAVVYRAKVRRGIGSKVTPNSAEFTINVLSTTPITPPAVIGGSFIYGTTVVITGTWTPTTGHAVSVGFRGVTYTVENGLSVTGSTFSLSLTGVPPGRYAVSAKVTDLAGNFAIDEDGSEVIIPAVLTKSRISLAFRRQVTHL